MRTIRKYRYIFAGILTIIIFSLGIFFSNFIDDVRSDSLRSELQEDVLDIESKQLQLALLQSDEIQSCEVLETGLYNIIIDYNDNLDRVLNYEENSFFKENGFQTIRRRYILSGVRYWMFAQELRHNCDYSANTLLFFSKEGDCKDCKTTGTQLTALKKKYRDQVLVFLVPLDIEDGLIEILQDTYNVTDAPTVVINGETKLSGALTQNQIEQHLEFPQ